LHNENYSGIADGVKRISGNIFAMHNRTSEAAQKLVRALLLADYSGILELSIGRL
jgi:hypothetical protein